MYVMYVHIATSICFDIRGGEVRRSTEDHGEVFGMRALCIIIIIVYPVIDSDELVCIYNGTQICNHNMLTPYRSSDTVVSVLMKTLVDERRNSINCIISSSTIVSRCHSPQHTHAYQGHTTQHEQFRHAHIRYRTFEDRD